MLSRIILTRTGAHLAPFTGTWRADAALLPNRAGHSMTRDNVNRRLDIAVARAALVHTNLAKHWHEARRRRCQAVFPHQRHGLAKKWIWIA
jgi:hypothetical protein